MKSHRETIFERALDCVSRGAERDLFYAAFELRCGKEARQQYLETWEHVSKSQRRLENCQSGSKCGSQVPHWPPQYAVGDEAPWVGQASCCALLPSRL